MSRESVDVAGFSSVLTKWIYKEENAQTLASAIKIAIVSDRAERRDRETMLGEAQEELTFTDSAIENGVSIAANCARFAYSVVADKLLSDQTKVFSKDLAEINAATAKTIFLDLDIKVKGDWEIATAIKRACLKTSIVASVTDAFISACKESDLAFDYDYVDVSKDKKILDDKNNTATSRMGSLIDKKQIDPSNIPFQAQKIFQTVLGCHAFLQQQPSPR